MATLGDATTPSSGTWFDVTGNKQFWTTNQFTMPTGGGIANSQNAYMGGHGGSVTMQFMLWNNVGGIFYQSGNIVVTSTVQWKSSANISGTYIPAGNYVIGFWSSGSVDWTFEGTGGATGRSGLSSPGTATSGSDEYAGQGFGRLGAYVDYTPLAAPSVSSATPNVGTSGTSVAVVGTSFAQATAVTIGGASASFVITDNTHITATVPAGASPGVGTLVVTNPAGSGSIAFTVGQLYFGDASGSGVVHSIVAVWYGDPSGSGVPHKVAGVWVPTGGPPPTGVKRVW